MYGSVEELNPATAAATTRLVAITYAAVGLPMLGAFLPRGDPTVWGWLIPGLVILAGVVISAIHRGVRVAAGHLESRQPVALLAENVICLFGTGCVIYGLSGAFGIYRLALLPPVLLMAVLGSWRMLAISWSAAVAFLVFATAGSIYDFSPLPAFVIAYGGVFLLLALFVRVLSRGAFFALHEVAVFADIAAVVARSNDPYSACDDLAPLLCRYLDARRVVMHLVHNRTLEPQAVSWWPATAAEPNAEQLNDVRIATVEGRIVIRSGWACVPVPGSSGIALMLIIERSEPRLIARMSYDQKLERIQVQLGALMTRLDLIASLEGLTRTDSLTDLPNRRALSERLEREVVIAGRTGEKLSVVMIDLDHFKRYNDTFGHVAGDELLKAVADVLRDRLRDTDFIARYGGEEFCAVLSSTDAPDAATVFHGIHRRVRDLDVVQAPTFSAGVAQWNGQESVTDLIDRADQALYRAKSMGRDQTQIAPAGQEPVVDEPADPLFPKVLLQAPLVVPPAHG